jgi:alpha/beta superfamily hydrolase
VCEIIQKINAKDMQSGFSTATFNKRGSSSRGTFEGGQIERDHATYFEDLAKKHRMRFPVVAAILHRLSLGYMADAQRMDDRAEINKIEYL